MGRVFWVWMVAGGLAYVAPAAVTFHKDVLPVLQSRCQRCHRPGEIAPMSFLRYQDARPWAKAMREAVLSRKMPPWSADARHGKFANDPSLTRKEIDTLVAWAEGGAAEGDPRDAPKPVEFTEGWNIDKPDVVFELPREFHVPAAGTIDYLHFVIPTGFTEDKWVRHAEVRPGNRAVVHHVIVYVREPGSAWLREARPGEPFVAASSRAGGVEILPAAIVAGFAPGLPPTHLGDGQGLLIRAGSDLVVQMHYTVTGKPATDRTRVGLIFARRTPTERVVNLAPHNRRFVIPAGAASHKVESSMTLTQPVTLLALMPHMHFRGKSFEYRAVYPTGETEVLLSVPKYDFNWQLSYALEKSIVLPRGTRIECTAHFDNSANNAFNPNPKLEVRWGDQTWEEMMIGWMWVATGPGARPSSLVREKDAAPAGE